MVSAIAFASRAPYRSWPEARAHSFAESELDVFSSLGKLRNAEIAQTVASQFKGKFPINYPRYTNPSGSRIIVDRVVRYENLIDELGEIFPPLNIPFDGDLGVRKKGHFRTDRTPYQSVLSPQQRQIVERVFAREVQLHRYRFAQAPTREAMAKA
jgi:hypothetical protein